MSATEHQASPDDGRNANINVRARRRQRDLIDQAAAVLGKTRSEIVLESACRAAEDVLLDQRFFTLDAEAFAQFQALLDAPPSENPKLRQLMAPKAPWDS